MLGIWPSRAITFLENHDTGSTLQHWPFPWEHAAQGYAYLLTHCGTPCVFYDHMYYDVELREHITKLIAIRKRFRINNKSEVCECGGGWQGRWKAVEGMMLVGNGWGRGPAKGRGAWAGVQPFLVE